MGLKELKAKKLSVIPENPVQDHLALNTIINNLPAMVFYKNLDGVYIAANEKFCNQLHTTPEEIVGKTDYDFYPFGEAEKYRQTDLFVINSGTIVDGIEEEIDVDGVHRNYATRKLILENEQGTPYGILGLAYDITLQKSMERDLQSLANYNQAIIKALPDLVFLFDRLGTFLDCFASNTKDLLYSPEKFIGKNVSELYDRAITENTLTAIQECLDSDSVQKFEYSILIASRLQHFEARFIKLEKDQALCISRNITERVELENDLILAKNRAEESSTMKSILIKNITHELRTPLTSIIGLADLLKTEIIKSDHQEMLLDIHDSGKRLLKTLNSIMLLSQLESGHQCHKNSLLDVNLEIENILKNFTAEVRKKGLYLKFAKNRFETGYMDRYFFKHIISNIVENAIKFTDQGGVEIEAIARKKNGVRILQIKFSDTGIGISKAHQKLIFEEFRQASEGSKRHFEGSGLGLTIASKLVQRLSGTIKVESKPGKGSIFVVELPFPETKDSTESHEMEN